ncbi:MAG: hypothetical protein J7577_17465 [Sphingobacteriaceae bacterium]|nr:hypothetical protein [Sphingobacteriaceae bacterium]
MSKKSLLNNWRKKIVGALLLLTIISAAFPADAQQTNVLKGPSGLTAKLINIESATNEPFRFSVSLHNGTSSQQLYELKADLPVGWQASYRVEGSQVTSVNLEAGKTQEIAVEITASNTAPAKKYLIPFKAVSATQSLSLQLEAVVKGSYGSTISTPSGRLSEEVTSGAHKEIELEVRNTGTLPLNDLEVTAQLPTGWEASFEPSKITKLEGGKKAIVKASLKVPDKTIAGDYGATFSLSGNNANGQAAFRIFVKTSLLSGWIGILVILIAIAAVYVLIRKYGRR